MADATDLKSVEGNLVRVRLPPSAPIFQLVAATENPPGTLNEVISVEQPFFVYC